MIILPNTTSSLQFKLASAITTNHLAFSCSYVDITTTAYTPGQTDGVDNGTTAVTIAAAPAASTQRQLKSFQMNNADTASATVTIIYNDNSTLRNVFVATLSAGDNLVYEDASGWSVIDKNGYIKMSAGGTTVWGSITGTLSSQTDLQTALNGKAASGANTDITSLAAHNVTGALTPQALVDISGASAGQIKFPSTQNASSNVNTLDDYKEGTFTPTDASGASLTFSTATGAYTKMGNAVLFKLRVTYPTTANASNARIGGLPYTSNTSGISVFHTLIGTPPNGQQAYINNSSSIVELNGAGFGPVTNANMSLADIYISGVYFTS